MLRCDQFICDSYPEYVASLEECEEFVTRCDLKRLPLLRCALGSHEDISKMKISTATRFLWQAKQENPKTKEELMQKGEDWVRKCLNLRSGLTMTDSIWDKKFNERVVSKFRESLGWSFYGQSKKGYCVLYTRFGYSDWDTLFKYTKLITGDKYVVPSGGMPNCLTNNVDENTIADRIGSKHKQDFPYYGPHSDDNPNSPYSTSYAFGATDAGTGTTNNGTMGTTNNETTRHDNDRDSRSDSRSKDSKGSKNSTGEVEFSTHDLVRCWLRLWEFMGTVRMRELSEESFREQEKRGYSGYTCDRLLLVVDLANFGVGTVSSLRAFLKNVADPTRHLYPESIAHVLIVNVPWLLKGPASALMSLLLHPVTQYKFKIISKHCDLEEYLDVDEIPCWLGGKNDSPLVNPDPKTNRLNGGVEREWTQQMLKGKLPIQVQRKELLKEFEEQKTRDQEDRSYREEEGQQIRNEEEHGTQCAQSLETNTKMMTSKPLLLGDVVSAELQPEESLLQSEDTFATVGETPRDQKNKMDLKMLKTIQREKEKVDVRNIECPTTVLLNSSKNTSLPMESPRSKEDASNGDRQESTSNGDRQEESNGLNRDPSNNSPVLGDQPNSSGNLTVQPSLTEKPVIDHRKNPTSDKSHDSDPLDERKLNMSKLEENLKELDKVKLEGASLGPKCGKNECRKSNGKSNSNKSDSNTTDDSKVKRLVSSCAPRKRCKHQRKNAQEVRKWGKAIISQPESTDVSDTTRQEMTRL